MDLVQQAERSYWDLVFAAPKSVSLLAAMAPTGAESIAAAHRVAVEDAFDKYATAVGEYERAGA